MRRAKEYLQQLKKTDEIINELEREKRELGKRLGRVSALDLIARADIINKLNAVADDIDKLNAEYAMKRHEISRTMHSLSRTEYIQLLDKIYIENKSLLRASREMHYSYEHIKRMHVLALKELEEKI